MALIQLTSSSVKSGTFRALYFRALAIDGITGPVDETPGAQATVYVGYNRWQVLESPSEIFRKVEDAKSRRMSQQSVDSTIDAAEQARAAAKRASDDLNNLKTALNAFGQDLQALRRQVDEIERKLSRLGAQNIDLHKTVDAQSSELVKLRSLIDGDGS